MYKYGQQSLQGPPPRWVCGSCHNASPAETEGACTGQIPLMRMAKGLPVSTHVGTAPPTPVRLRPFYTMQARTPSPCKYLSSPTNYFLLLWAWFGHVLDTIWPETQQSYNYCTPAQPSSLHSLCSACQVPPAYLLSSVTSAGADGPKVLLLPLLSNLVHFPIVIARGLICGGTRGAQLHGLCLALSILGAAWRSEQEPLASVLSLFDWRLTDWQGEHQSFL